MLKEGLFRPFISLNDLAQFFDLGLRHRRPVHGPLLGAGGFGPSKPAWRDIVDCFGPKILLPDQSVDRKALARIIFGDDTQRKILERIIHPRIWEEQRTVTEEIVKKDPTAIIVRDVPLLFEARLEHNFTRIILVYVPAHVQLARLMERDGLNREEAQSRLDAQMPIGAKIPLAHYVIYNEGTIENTRSQVEKVFVELRQLERSKDV